VGSGAGVAGTGRCAGCAFTAVAARYVAMRGVPVTELAAKACYSPGYVAQVIAGSRPVSAGFAARLDEALSAGGEITAAAAAEHAVRDEIRDAYQRGRADALAELAAFIGRQAGSGRER